MVSRSTRTVKMLDTLIVRKVEVLFHATSILLDIPLEVLLFKLNTNSNRIQDYREVS